jgi:copper chaperone NosL
VTSRSKRLLAGGTLLVATTILIVALVASAAVPPEGPVDLAWDRAQCAECGMLVGEPAYAAQLHDHDGTVHAFDDAGCLLRWKADHGANAQAVYFHHVRENRWLAERDAAFLRVPRTPMGYGLGAVARGTAGAIEQEAARNLVLAPERRP